MERLGTMCDELAGLIRMLCGDGERDRMRHNYQVSIRLLGSRTISNDGYLLDFGDMKTAAKSACRELNEFFLCPALSDVMRITTVTGGGGGGGGAARGESVRLVCED